MIAGLVFWDQTLHFAIIAVIGLVGE